MLLSFQEKLQSKKLILGSSSPRRAEIFRGLGLQFEVQASTFPEDLDKSKFPMPEEYAKETCRRKALEIFDRLYRSVPKEERPDLIITADSIVVHKEQIFEKPTSPEHTKKMITMLGTSEHSVITGVTFVLPKKQQQQQATQSSQNHQNIQSGEPFVLTVSEKTLVTFEKMSELQIEMYAQSGLAEGKAGGYGVQDISGGGSFAKINGCFYNAMGFPISCFCKQLIAMLEQNLL